jgi:hypothetical protein
LALREGTYHVWRCDIVQQIGDTTTTTSSDGDIQDPLGLFVCLFERYIANVRPKHLFQDTNFQEVPDSPPSLDAPAKRFIPPTLCSAITAPAIRESLHVDGVAR